MEADQRAKLYLEEKAGSYSIRIHQFVSILTMTTNGDSSVPSEGSKLGRLEDRFNLIVGPKWQCKKTWKNKLAHPAHV